jgi:uncharacterized protein with von Willebrand factor type A (vWA) domain
MEVFLPEDSASLDVTPCGHTFHILCLSINKSIQTSSPITCPSCRTPLVENDERFARQLQAEEEARNRQFLIEARDRRLQEQQEERNEQLREANRNRSLQEQEARRNQEQMQAEKRRQLLLSILAGTCIGLAIYKYLKK